MTIFYLFCVNLAEAETKLRTFMEFIFQLMNGRIFMIMKFVE